MKPIDLDFTRPKTLEAGAPPEERGLRRDEVRLLVTTPDGHVHAQFYNLPHFLTTGDLLVVNDSATLPASLPAEARMGAFTINLSTCYGGELWLAEPRWNSAQPGPLPLKRGEEIEVGGVDARLVGPYPGLPRLWFVQGDGHIHQAMADYGTPIRYGYVRKPYPLAAYQTLFSAVSGSAEMPSAARPFTRRVTTALERHGVQITRITLHTGVSSMEIETEDVEDQPMYPEPFCVSPAAAEAVNTARREGRRVIAVGTTVVRALESAWDGQKVRPISGYTRVFVHPRRGVHVIDGLLTGLHDPVSTHLAMLLALAGTEVIREAYREALEAGYLWHEFGDSHLILVGEAAGQRNIRRQVHSLSTLR